MATHSILLNSPHSTRPGYIEHTWSLGTLSRLGVAGVPIKEVALPVFGASEPKRLAHLSRPFGNVAAPQRPQYMSCHAFQSAVLPDHCEFLYLR